jgi:hypothetical protein
MTDRISGFARTVVTQGVETVLRGSARDARLVFHGSGPKFPICITVELCPPRHGCGWEQDAYWAHTNDADLFAGSHGPSLSVARNDPKQLIEEVCRFLDSELSGQSRVEARIVYGQYQGQSFLPIYEGDSDTGRLRDMPEFNGM